MYSEALRQGLEAMRAQIAEPMTDIQLIKEAMVREVAKKHQVVMPPILNEERWAKVLKDIDLLEAFLCTEDGDDAMDLLMNTWEAFVAKQR